MIPVFRHGDVPTVSPDGSDRPEDATTNGSHDNHPLYCGSLALTDPPGGNLNIFDWLCSMFNWFYIQQ